MKTTSYYPVIMTDRVAETAGFYCRHFRFAPLFESDWYVHLQSTEDEKVTLAILDASHETVPEKARAGIAGLAAMPAVFPAFVKAAWLGIEPEYNPFKYNSFPVRAGAESHRMTVILADKIEAARASGRINSLPPVLTFQSVGDSTVSACPAASATT